MAEWRSFSEGRVKLRRRSHKKYCDSQVTFSPSCNRAVYAVPGDYSTVHRKLLIGQGGGARPWAAPDQSCALRCGGGDGGGIRARIRGDVEKRAGRGCRHDVRGNYVPLPGEALAAPIQWGRIRGRDPLPRMSRVSRIRSAPHGRSTTSEVWSSPKVHCTGTALKSASRRITPGRRGYSILRRSHLGAAGGARLDRPQTSSTSRTRARAWDVAARCEQLCPVSTRGYAPPRAAKTDRVEASHRATTSQSRAARMARADGRNNRRSRDLRRAKKSLVRAGVAAG